MQYNCPCLQDVHHVDYLATFYCRQGEGRIFVALGFLFWMALLFWVMSKVAEDFLVPALEVCPRLPLCLHLRVCACMWLCMGHMRCRGMPVAGMPCPTASARKAAPRSCLPPVHLSLHPSFPPGIHSQLIHHSTSLPLPFSPHPPGACSSWPTGCG